MQPHDWPKPSTCILLADTSIDWLERQQPTKPKLVSKKCRTSIYQGGTAAHRRWKTQQHQCYAKCLWRAKYSQIRQATKVQKGTQPPELNFVKCFPGEQHLADKPYQQQQHSRQSTTEGASTSRHGPLHRGSAGGWANGRARQRSRHGPD